jgi:signal transduction histidine kinase
MTFNVKAQNNFLDSLNHLLSSNPSDSIRASVLGDLCWHYKYSDAKKALQFGFEAIELAQKNNHQAVQAYATNNVGVVYWAMSNYDSAAWYIQKTREIYRGLDNERGMAVTSTNLGLIYQNMGNYDRSLEYQMEALQVAEKLKDQALTASILTNIGNVHFLNENMLKAKDYYFQSLAIKEKQEQTGFRQNIQKTLVNIGNVYGKLNDQDSAIYYLMAAQPFAERAEDYKSLSLIYTDLGHAYSKVKDVDKANESFQKALEIFNSNTYSNDYDKSILLWSLAENELRRGFLEQAIRYGEQSLSLAKELKNLNRLKDSYSLLQEIYEESGQYKEALGAGKNLRIYQDSLMNLETNEKIAELETKYETEKKDQQITLLDQENNVQKASNQRNNVIIIALIIGVLLLLLLFYIWRQRVRIGQQKVVNEQKIRLREAQIQAVINSEEKERKRFASDLHDSMGQLVSALSMNIQGLKNASNDTIVRNEIVDNSTTLLHDIQSEIRNIAFNLMPQVLTNEGLIPALQELTARINKSNQIKADVQSFAVNERFNEVFEISLYRILQEWISNILKYAGASEILIQVVAHDDEVIITVEDNGKGFDLQFFRESKGNGWRNINTRLNLIEGAMDIDTEQGRKNTTLTLTIDKSKAFTSLQLVNNT